MLEEAKEQAYMELCSDVKKYYTEKNKMDNADMLWTPYCEKEINLWTYWQGLGIRSPKILLVGQDWGCPFDGSFGMDNITAINKGETRNIFDSVEGDKIGDTDRNLAELFKSIGYEDIIGKRYSDLFFTNLVLGYRRKGTSGNFKPEWVTESLTFFYRLVNILFPEVILCLGKHTFDGVMRSFSIDSPIKGMGYNEYIETRNVPTVKSESRKAIPVFPLAHCGAIGTMNRNSGCGRSSVDLSKQLEDWKYIKAYL